MESRSQPPSPPPPPPPEPPQALPLALDLPAELPLPAPTPGGAARPARPAGTKGSARPRVVRVLVALAVLAVGLVAAGIVLLPRWVRQRFIDAAAAHGIALSIDGASIEAGGFRLTGLRATAADLPGFTATAPELELMVETAGLRPTRVTIRGAEIAYTGAWSQLDATLSTWGAGSHGAPGAAATDGWRPQELVLDGSRLVWRKAAGDATGVECNDTRLAIAWRSDGAEEVHGRSDRAKITVPGGELGPWRIDLDREDGPSGASGLQTRVRVALDPGVPESSTLLVVGDETGTTGVDVSIPRSPPARLGLPPALLGLRGKDVQVEAKLHYADLGGGHAELTFAGGVHGVEIGSIPRPLDITWEGAAGGDARQGMDLRHARLAAGPLVGPLTGTVKTFDDGARVDLAWSAPPVPCGAFDAPLDESQPFDIAYQLRKLAEATGITKIAGQVSARGTAAFDTRDLGSAHVDVEPQVSCQVALFGQ